MGNEELYLVTERVNDLTALGCRTNHEIEYLKEEKRSVKYSRQICEPDHQRVSCCTKNGFSNERQESSSTYSSPSTPSHHPLLFDGLRESTIMTATPVDTSFNPKRIPHNVLDFHSCPLFSSRFQKLDGDHDHHHHHYSKSFELERTVLGKRELEAINNTNNNNLSEIFSSITSSNSSPDDADSSSQCSFREEKKRKRRILEDGYDDRTIVKGVKLKCGNVLLLNVIFVVTIIGLQLLSSVNCYPSSSGKRTVNTILC